MKYRIKDPDVVQGFKALGWTYEFDEDDVRRFGFYWHGDCRDRIFFNPYEEFEVEPVNPAIKEFDATAKRIAVMPLWRDRARERAQVAREIYLSNKSCKPEKTR